jgi:predicted  nucleic acid-binding Zn-ribbon protein
MRWVLLMRNLSRYRSSLCRIALIAIGFGISGYVGQASAQDTAKAGLSTRNNVEFLAVKIRAAQIQPELSRLDQELETFAARLKDRSDLSPTTKASAISQVEQAQAVLRSHAETLRRAAANLTDWTTAGQEIDALAEMLNMQGEQILRVVTDEIARQDGNADQLVIAATTYRAAVTQLVEAARKAREHSQVVGGSRGGGDKR